MKQSENNFLTLWKLMDGHRARYAAALLAMFAGIGLIFLTPLITRGAIDGIIDPNTGSDASILARFLASQKQHWGTGATLAMAAAMVIAITAIAGVFMYIQGRNSGIASETIVRRLRDRL
jgi:ABC-type multidrug transport system fused ATPase/permease subunit